MKQEPKMRYETGIPLRPASIEEAGFFYSQADLAGRVSYADGTTQAFTDPRQYLQTIKEELPFRNTTGFQYETLTADPQVRKEVDDIILDFAGEENPRRACGYAHDGFGCSPHAIGRSIRCTCLGDGEHTRWNRADFIGVLKDEFLPDWAKEKLEQLSAAGHLREAPSMSGMSM